MEAREKRIKQELDRERGISTSESDNTHRSRIAGSFKEARKLSKPSGGTLKATLLRFGILLFLTVFLITFLEFGRPAFYLLLLFVPFYIYLKFIRK